MPLQADGMKKRRHAAALQGALRALFLLAPSEIYAALRVPPANTGDAVGTPALTVQVPPSADGLLSPCQKEFGLRRISLVPPAPLG